MKINTNLVIKIIIFFFKLISILLTILLNNLLTFIHKQIILHQSLLSLIKNIISILHIPHIHNIIKIIINRITLLIITISLILLHLRLLINNLISHNIGFHFFLTFFIIIRVYLASIFFHV